MARLYHPDPNVSASFAGKSYQSKDGVVDVPEAAVAELLHHGFSLTKPKPAPEPSKDVPADKHGKVLDELVAAKQKIAELEGKVQALAAERDAAKAELAKAKKA